MEHEKIQKLSGRELDRRIAEAQGVDPGESWTRWSSNDALAAELRREMMRPMHHVGLSLRFLGQGIAARVWDTDMPEVEFYAEGECAEAVASCRAYLYWKERQ